MNRQTSNPDAQFNKSQEERTASSFREASNHTPDTSDSVQSMAAEIRLVSAFHTMTICRIVLSVALLLFEALRAAYGLRISSALYILLFANLGPWLIELALTPRLKLSSPPAILPYLRRHYHYSALRHSSNRICFWITCFLLILWERHNAIPNYPFAWLYHVPLYLLCLLLCIRMFGPRLLSHRIDYKLMHGKIK